MTRTQRISPDARCAVSTARACPPEDVGGSPGYAEFLEALAEPKHPEHRNFLDWIGGKFETERFDVAAINVALERIKV